MKNNRLASIITVANEIETLRLEAIEAEQEIRDAFLDEQAALWEAENYIPEEECALLCAFFKENLAGHTDEEYALGSKMYSACHEYWSTLKDESIRCIGDERIVNPAARAIAQEVGCTAQECVDAFNLSMDASYYSDWHKDVYGYRPRW